MHNYSIDQVMIFGYTISDQFGSAADRECLAQLGNHVS